MTTTPPLPSSSQSANAPGATTSLVLGILSICCFWIFTAIPAIIVGASARKKVAQSNGALGGDGIALAGIITGAIGIIAGLIPLGMVASLAIPAIAVTSERAQSAKIMSDLRSVAVSCHLYAVEKEGKFPASLDDLVPDYIEDPIYLTYETEDGERKRFRYRPGLGEDSPIEPFFLGPELDNRGYVVGYTDGSVGTVRSLEEIDPEILDQFD